MVALADRLLANKRFEFISTATRADDGKPYQFAVVEMEGFEAISKPFRFTLTLVSDDASINFDAMLRYPATFVIHGPEGNMKTPYHGVLAEFEQLHRADGYVFYRAVLVPRLWRLSLYRISEVYLDEQPITATLESVLKGAQLSPADYEFRLTGSYRPRSFVCQYEETHLDFVSRWLENEGIYYYFDHDGHADKLVAVDSRAMHEAQAVPVDYRPDDELDTGVSGRSVRDFVSRQKPLPKEVILQDYNHRKAALQLKASAVVSETGLGQVMLYGENFRDEPEGKHYAKLRAEEIGCTGRVFSGEGTAVGLRSGRFAELSHHYREDFNGRYLVTEVHHQGSQAGALLSGIKSPYSGHGGGAETIYRNSFRAIPAAMQYRPERTTPKPRVAGTMNATIDSEGSGEYAELDEYGQYKVQLPFDLSDKRANKGSARVRMATPYSGSDHGMHFPLLKGAEVLLSFTDGDPDRPVIVGAVPNSENRNIVSQANAQENRIATAGGNQLYMSDTRGKEVVFLHSPSANSTLGIGSTDAEGRGSILMATAGSSESVTAGVSNSMTAGAKSSISLSSASELDAGASNKYALGMNTSLKASADVAWNIGQSITLDEHEKSVAIRNASQTEAESVKIRAGRSKVTSVMMKRVNRAVLSAVLASLAANGAVAGGLAEVLGGGAEGKKKAGDKAVEDWVKKNPNATEEEKEKARRDAEENHRLTEIKQPYTGTEWNPNSTVAVSQSLGGAAISVTVHSLVQSLAASLAGYLERAYYDSTIELDKSGVKIKAKMDLDLESVEGDATLKCGQDILLDAGKDFFVDSIGEMRFTSADKMVFESMEELCFESHASFNFKSIDFSADLKGFFKLGAETVQVGDDAAQVSIGKNAAKVDVADGANLTSVGASSNMVRIGSGSNLIQLA
ncbi:type VI secretion system Vgr family protein [Ralstonia sp. UBA689]|uniref:type VI secretion system Vgr family protein n=1 Tax=Ralstonia sp. UBA689 TaxID=1947373 RepID=UPI0025D794A8|nr:type VI secretion system tip protein TssI/VgrG [Ralstonia sp. UBA689]